MAIDQNQERSERVLIQRQARDKMKMEQDFVNEIATLRNAQKAKKVAADTEEQTVQALKIVANKKKLEMDEKEIDDLKLEHAINKITAEDEGEVTSTTDKQNLAESRVEIESKRRELGKLANEAKHQAQGELAGGEIVDGAINAKVLSKKITPELTRGVSNKAALLLGIQDIMKKSELGGDNIKKLSMGNLSGNPLGNMAVQMAGKVQSGFTNYFRQ